MRSQDSSGNRYIYIQEVFSILYTFLFSREDDEADLSDFEEETNAKNGASGASETRVSMNFRERAHQERQAIRDRFLEIEQGDFFYCYQIDNYRF